MTKRILSAVLVLAICSPALAQPALANLSGDFYLNDALELTSEGEIPFTATLIAHTGAVCQLTGRLAVREVEPRLPRQLSSVPGGTFILCPGKSPALVAGGIVPTWIPPQQIFCTSWGYRNSYCNGYSASVEAGVFGKWLTWHALGGEVKAARGAKHD